MKHLAKRALTFVLVVAMVLSTAAVTALADDILIAPNPSGANVHTLEANTLEAFDKGAKADGDSTAYDSYFTILWSKNAKVDSSTKSWDDGYTSSQRINFGGAGSAEKNSVKFTTSGAAKVKIWWAKNGDSDRQMAVFDTDGKAVVSTEGEHASNQPFLDTLEIADAGTYYLGSTNGGNYIFKIEVEEAGGDKVSTLEANTMDAFDKGAKADGDTTAYDSYFTVLWSKNSKVDSSTKTWDDGYTSSQRINFGGAGSDEKNAIKFTTSGEAKVKIWWAKNGDSDRQMAIFDTDGKAVVSTEGEHASNQPFLDTLELTEAGTYFLGSTNGGNYIFKVEVTEAGGPKEPRAMWAGLVNPYIEGVSVDSEDPGKLNVTVHGVVGYDGADQITVVMRDGDGWQLKSLSSLKETDTHVLSFEPEETGDYVFSVSASREDEDSVHNGSKTVAVSFTYPLGVPVMKYAVNDGKGGITVEWNSVKEATGYIVKAGDKSVTVDGGNTTRAVVSGLTVGKEYDVSVAAVRANETGKACEPMKTTVSETAEIAWVFSTFGQSTSLKNNGYEEKDNGDVRVYSINGSGKVQPSAQDGLAFYYTAIDPSTTNFKLTATAHVNTWHYSNGQDGFGLIVMDKVGVNGDTAPVWSNSLMAGVTGFSDTYNGQKVQMRLGVGSLQRSGVTENVTTATAPSTYTGTWRTLDITGFGSDIRNLVGNCDNESAVPGKTLGLVDFTLTIEKDDAGYHISYLDHNGVLRTNDYLDPDALSYVDPYVYVGMFAARNADITFTDIKLTTSAATSTGSKPGAGEGGKTAELSADFRNPTATSAQKTELDVRVNVDGKAVVTDKAGTELYKGVVKAGERNLIPVTLAAGENSFTAVITPDKDAVTADGAKLSSYEAKTVTASVSYGADSRTEIYVGPNGKADAAGTRADPTTLAEAVKSPAPGTTIILLAGTYKLNSGVTIQRGVDGTADKPITLKADPYATTRPVLDWGEKGSGLTLSASYWHLYGFDTIFANGKGLHIGGKNNVIERVNAHDNMQSGISISRTWSSDDFIDWPSDNLVLNCSAWLNADSGYEDADGFEAKLTNGDGNVFDGCIAAYNADDGWDLFARGTANGTVTIRNSIAFKNGIDIVDGKEVKAGNGNGFKLGGNSYAVNHVIENSLAFANTGNGFTCNSNPNLSVVNCTGYNNGKGNLALYSEAANSAYKVTGFISYLGGNDSIAPKGTQDRSDYLKNTNYFTNHTSGAAVSADWFKSVDTDAAIISGISRNADGTISMNGCLELTGKAPVKAGARLPGAQGQNFRDVMSGSWYYDDVVKICKAKYVNGVTAAEFGPEGTFNRAQMATVLHRLAGTPKASAQSKYTDTDRVNGKWYIDAVDWISQKGYMYGSGESAFKPMADITRQEIAVALYNYAKDTGIDVTAKGTAAAFTDSGEIAAWATDAMTWAIEAGIIQGNGAGLCKPEANATRAEMAVMVARFMDLIKK